jgi:hypothetical protein
MSCATPYQSKTFGGGFSDTQLAPDVFRIYFRGNAFTSMERAQDFALLRAADLAQQEGFSYFAVIDEKSATSVQTLTMPGHSYTTGSAFAAGNFATYSGQTTYYPGQTFNFYKPKTGLLIRCFVRKPDGIYAFDAAFMERSIIQKYGLEKLSTSSASHTALMHEEKQEQATGKNIMTLPVPVPRQVPDENVHHPSESRSKPALLSSHDIVCNFSIFNRGRDRSLIVKVDSIGESHSPGGDASKIFVDGKEYRAADIFLSVKSKEDSGSEILLLGHGAAQATLRFGNIADFRNRLSNLELRLYSADYGDFTVTFRKVPLGHSKKSFPDVTHGDLLFHLNGCKPYKSYEVFSN